MKNKSRVRYRDWDCAIRARKYNNGNLAIELLEAETGDHFTTCTVNVGKIDDSLNAVAVKDYSENEGMLDFLKENGLVGDTLYTVQSGFVIVPVVKLTESGLELFQEVA